MDISNTRALSIIMCLTFLGNPITYSQEKQRPNILFIAVDDLNNYVSILKNYPGIKTPNLDKFSKKSFTFTKAYCPSPVCNPSRIAILTGLSPSSTGLYQLQDAFSQSNEAVNSILIPELFKQHNYTTMWSGKIFHTGGSPEQTRPDQSRLDMMWDDVQGKDGGYGPMPTEVNIPKSIEKPIWFDYQEWKGPDADFPDVINTDYTIGRLNKNYKQPFFMALGLYRPHNPWTVPQRFYKLYPKDSIVLPIVDENDLDDLPDLGREWAESPVKLSVLKDSNHYEATVRSYLAAISFMDYNLGRVLEALNNSPHRNNTIVVLWSDNGFHMGEKHHFAKQALWEQSSQVLLMIRIPNMKNEEVRIDEPVNLIDIYPTLIDLCDIGEPPQELDGQSLYPFMTNPSLKASKPSLTFYKHGSVSIRTDKYRYIRYYDGTHELYNEEADPYEIHNLAHKDGYQNVIDSLGKWIPNKIKPTVTKLK